LGQDGINRECLASMDDKSPEKIIVSDHAMLANDLSCERHGVLLCGPVSLDGNDKTISSTASEAAFAGIRLEVLANEIPIIEDITISGFYTGIGMTGGRLTLHDIRIHETKGAGLVWTGEILGAGIITVDGQVEISNGYPVAFGIQTFGGLITRLNITPEGSLIVSGHGGGDMENPQVLVNAWVTVEGELIVVDSNEDANGIHVIGPGGPGAGELYITKKTGMVKASNNVGYGVYLDGGYVEVKGTLEACDNTLEDIYVTTKAGKGFKAGGVSTTCDRTFPYPNVKCGNSCPVEVVPLGGDEKRRRKRADRRKKKNLNGLPRKKASKRKGGRRGGAREKRAKRKKNNIKK